MGHAVTSQAETVNVAGGVFGGGEGGGSAGGFACARTLAGRGLVVAGGSDEVTVAGVKIEAIQALESGEGIWQDPTHVGLDLRNNLTEQRKPPLALEALEEGGPEDLGFVAIREILKKIPSALEQAQAPADAGFQPKLVREGGAVPTGPGEIEKPEKRFEEFDTDNGFTGSWIGHKFFQT
jgi:hypothetical protein